jgi:hypothetical protein
MIFMSESKYVSFSVNIYETIVYFAYSLAAKANYLENKLYNIKMEYSADKKDLA